ncbi:ash family protein [Salmonella enterica]|nr:ash family protein [Salmonella enterica]EKT1324361.1 ash family protein [Salmonella enterica]EKT1357457.1 ash family protein [Salmonella enterica]EKT2633788.1 ash family protein [Salmonella enterica]EKT3222463.1 ash family protein [Salmonella enterica]
MCRAFCCTSMVGRAGALQSAPVSVRPVRSTPSGSTTHEIDLSGGGNNFLLTGGCPMATTFNQTHPLLNISFNAATDFTVLASHCENFAETLIESNDIALKMALCGRINTCLTLLQPTLLEPVPPHLVESLTVDVVPAESPRFGPECTELCNYCLALTQTLAGQGFSSETEKYLSWLLYDLINYFAAEMKAPRWLRTPDGVKFIDGVAA